MLITVGDVDSGVADADGDADEDVNATLLADVHDVPEEVWPTEFVSTFLTSNAVISPKFLFLSAEFHLFFTAFGGLPLPSAFAISVHLFPYARWYFTMSSSSSLVQASLRTSGARWLKYLSLHCFPTRKGMCLAMLDHF